MRKTPATMRAAAMAMPIAIAIGTVANVMGCGSGRTSATQPTPEAVPPIRYSNSLLVGTQADCRSAFHDQDGWQGGDVAASIPLGGLNGVNGVGERRSVWLFGDSFVTTAGRRPERRYPFVHNAIAVSHCDASGNFTLDFAWGDETTEGDPERTRLAIGRADRAKPSSVPVATRAFFEPDPKAAWVERVFRETGEAPYYWPLSGVAIGDTLYVALLRIAEAPARGPFRLPFRPVGVDLARVEPTRERPETWRVRYSTLSSRGDILPATSLVVAGDHLLAFATLDRSDGRAPRILSRIPLTALEPWRPDLEPFVEALAADGRWRAGLEAGGTRILMDDDASEMSVHFDPGLREWLAVYGDPTGDTIWMRRAERVEGPWSRRLALFAIPELATVDDPLPGKPFCYAGKAHPELAPSGQLVVSYVCNVFAEHDDAISDVLERLRTTGWIYRPKLVRLAIPSSQT